MLPERQYSLCILHPKPVAVPPNDFRTRKVLDIDNRNRTTFSRHESQIALQLDVVWPCQCFVVMQNGDHGKWLIVALDFIRSWITVRQFGTNGAPGNGDNHNRADENEHASLHSYCPHLHAIAYLQWKHMAFLSPAPILPQDVG